MDKKTQPRETNTELTRDEVKEMIKEKLEQPSAAVPQQTSTEHITDGSLDINLIKQDGNDAKAHKLEIESHKKEPHEDIYDEDALEEQVDTGEISTDEEGIMQGYEEEAKDQIEKKHDSI